MILLVASTPLLGRIHVPSAEPPSTKATRP
jgi:hypothetical protein